MTDIPGDGVGVRRTYHQQLEGIRADLVRMAAMVTEAIPRATQALGNHRLRAKEIRERNVVAVSPGGSGECIPCWLSARMW